MASTLGDRLNDVHPQMLRARSEGDRKKLAAAGRAVIGKIVERALDLAAMTKQEAAYAMGYSDQGVVSRWCSGVERPLFDKLLAIPLRPSARLSVSDALIIAFGEVAGDGVEVETHIRIVRRRTA